MSLVFSDLTAADWAEFEGHAPAACAWLRTRALERESARLAGLRQRTAWQQRRLEELQRLTMGEQPPSKIGWLGTSGTDMETHDY